MGELSFADPEHHLGDAPLVEVDLQGYERLAFDRDNLVELSDLPLMKQELCTPGGLVAEGQ